jgi:hypothetical protein
MSHNWHDCSEQSHYEAERDILDTIHTGRVFIALVVIAVLLLAYVMAHR